MYIDIAIKKGKTIIVEGVHLNPYFCESMMEKYNDQCFSFVMHIKNSYELLRRS